MATKKFVVWDWVVFGITLGVSILIGIFYALRSRFRADSNTTGEFLMGSRRLHLLPVSISILVSFMSAITILGAPAEMYTAGTMYFLYTLGLILACLLSAALFVPLFYPLKLTSSFEYLDKRFQSKAAKLTGALIMIVQQVIYMGISSFAPSTALEAVTGFPTWGTIVIIGGVATVYTFMGGIKAVIWTDVFQSMVMFAGLLAVAIQGIIKVGGLGEVWRVNSEWDRIEFWEFDPDPTLRQSTWSLVVGGTVMWVGVFGVTQASVQRYCAVTTLKKATWSVLVNIISCIILMVLACLAGIVMFAYYAKTECDPLSDGQVGNANQLIPYFVMEVLGYPGLPGLFISCLFSGALSSVSSSLNALAAVFWEDIFKPLIGEKMSESNKTWITRGLVAVVGGAGIAFAFLAQNLGGTVLQASFSFTGAASGPMLGVFLLGGLFPFANYLGCVFGGILGLVMSMWVSIGAYSLPKKGYGLDFPSGGCPVDIVNSTLTTLATVTDAAPVVSTLTGVQHLYTVSYLWFPSIGTAATVIIGIIVSLITRPFLHKQDVDPRYLIPFFDRLFFCLPESWRRPLRFGYEFQNPEDIVPECEEEKNEVYTGGDLSLSVEASAKFNGHSEKQQPFRNGVSGLSYRPSKSEFVYDNNSYRGDNAEKPKQVFTSNV